jgi:hypothetical protein
MRKKIIPSIVLGFLSLIISKNIFAQDGTKKASSNN